MKLLILDMDGVIIDSESVHSKIQKNIFRELGGEISDDINLDFVGITDQDIWRKAKADYNLPQDENEIIRLKKDRFIDAIDRDEVKLTSKFIEFLTKAKSLNIDIVIASSNDRKTIEKVIDYYKLDKFIDAYISGEDVEKGKPSPEIFLNIAKQMGEKPDNVLVIEDSRHGVMAAKSANMYCIGYKNLDSGNQDLSKADVIIDEFNDETIEMILKLVYK